MSQLRLRAFPTGRVTRRSGVLGKDLSGNPGAFDRSMQHHLVDVLFKDGVYERWETVETFSHAEN